MMHELLSLFVVTVVVVVDNALLAGLLLPSGSRFQKLQLSVIVAIAIAASQVAFALGSQQLLRQDVFRYAAIVVLIVMAIQTLQFGARQPMRGFNLLRAFWKVYLYTAVGNIDNLIWLGVEVGKRDLWLLFFSILTLPVFVTVAILFSYECERHRWVVLAGAGMPAWAAVTLFVHSQLGKEWLPHPLLWQRIALTAVILALGLLLNQMQLRLRTTTNRVRY